MKYVLVASRYGERGDIRLDATELEAAKVEALEHCLKTESEYPTLYGVAEEFDLSWALECLRQERQRLAEDKRKADDAAAFELQERAEYERLRAKFGGGT